MSMNEIIKEIEQSAGREKAQLSAKTIQDALKRGNSIEIHPAKDGVRIYEVKKKVIG